MQERREGKVLGKGRNYDNGKAGIGKKRGKEGENEEERKGNVCERE